MRKCEQSPSAVTSPRSPRDCFQQKLDKPGKGIVYKDIDDEIKRSLGSTLTCEGKSLSFVAFAKRGCKSMQLLAFRQICIQLVFR